MATVVDVANRAGVSVATVSRVLNSNYIVTKEKRDKVYKAMQELGYQPKTSTKTEKNIEKNVIVVLVTVMMEEVLAGMHDMAAELDYEIIISYSSNTRKNSEIIEGISKEKLLGVILVNTLMPISELEDISSRYPVVQCLQGVELERTFLVAIDDEKAAYDVTKKMIIQGKKNIAFLGVAENDKMAEFSYRRFLGYKKALDEFDVNYKRDLVFNCDLSYDSGVEMASNMLKLKDKIDAVFCVQDTLAAGCINTFKESGLSIPSDIAVSGFDNTEVSQMSSPKITTVEQPFYEIGYETIKMLDSIIKGNITTGRKLLINHKLVERASTFLENN